MLDTPQIATAEATETATIHLQVPRNEIQKVIGPAMQEVMSTLATQGVKPAGPMFSYHLQIPSDRFDFEVGVPVARRISSAGRVEASGLPQSKVARPVYRGSYDGLGNAWGEFNAWIAAEGLDAKQSLWESYVVGPATESDPAKWVTELYRPLNDYKTR